MRISRCASASSSLVRPVRSAPNNTAAGPRALISKMRSAASCRSSARKFWSRGREVVAATNPQSATASATLSTTRAARQQVVGARGARGGLRMRKRLGAHQDQLRQRHVLHGARHRPDVSGVRGLDEHDANGGERHGLYHSGPFRSLLHPMQPLLNIAVRAARRAGDIIVRAIPRLESVEVHSKGRNDYVTEVDRAAEADIIETIRRLHPDHAFLAEESGARGDKRRGLDHRSARRHHQLHARLPDVRGVDRLPGPGPARARGGVRSHAPGAVHRLARRRRAVSRAARFASASRSRSKAR